MRYTEKIHARRLARILEIGPCTHCPASQGYSSNKSSWFNWDRDGEDPCIVCTTFVGLNDGRYCPCPCHELGRKEAIKRSKIALRKFYKKQK